MKKSILFIFLIISFDCISADWDLFPKNQSSYFIYPSYGDLSYINLFLMDSVSTTGQAGSLYFRKNTPSETSCNEDSIRLQVWPGTDLYYIDSLDFNGDTTFLRWNQSITPFYFLKNAIPGQSWTIVSTYNLNDYTSITINCVSEGVQTFFGITDSVKTYTMTPNGSSSGQIPVSNFTMRLSKHYGFLEYVPLILFLYHPSYIDFVSMKLIGLNDGNNAYGYSQPEFADYFHLTTGDILFWSRYVVTADIMTPDWNEYYRDSITQVHIDPDSVVYIFDRMVEDSGGVITQHSGLTRTFLKREFAPILENEPEWTVLSNIDFFTDWNIIPSNRIELWSTEVVGMIIDSVSSDSIKIYTAQSGAYSVDTNTCSLNQILDEGFTFKMNTKVGLSEYCHIFFGEDCTYLTGMRINGVVEGNISLGVSGLQNFSSAIHIFPNPVNDELNVTIKSGKNISFCEIYDSFGKLVKVSLLNNGKVNVNGFSSGIYFIKLYSGDEMINSKFIKQ